MDIACVVDIRADTGECPVWDPEQQVLWWVDIPGCRLYRFDPTSGENRAFALPAPCGAFALRERGGMLLALKSGLHLFEPSSGELTLATPPPFAHPDDRFNDGRCDRQGRFWVCSMRDPQDANAKAGVFYRVDADLRLEPVIDGLITGNGLAFSPDGRTMYMSDSHAAVQTVWAFDYDPASGAIANRRVFADMHEIAGRPDGAAVDAEGCYWSAANAGGQLVRYTPQGRIERRIALPVQRPTMLAFGGPALDTVYVTSQTPRPGDPPLEQQPHAGGLFTLSPGIKGLLEPRFRG